MPAVTQGNPHGGTNTSYIVKDFDYKYPNGLNLRPDSKLHQKIKDEVLTRARESHQLIANRIPAWNEIERTMTTYIDLSESEKELKSGDSRKPVSIVFPYSYVILETLLTYLVMAFLNDPIFRYSGSSPEDTIGAMMLEKVIQKQCTLSKVGLSLHTFLRDSIVYGLGACAPVWEKIPGIRVRESRSGLMSFFMGHGKKVYEKEIIREGNKLNNIDPFMYLPDPSVPSHRVQEGEYVGWIDRTSKTALLKRESVDNSIFNVKYLDTANLKHTSIITAEESDRGKKTGVDHYTTMYSSIHNPVDVIYMYVDLIPKEWELGSGEYPERWLFGLGNDEVVVQAQELGLSHGMYPIITAAPDFDGYSVLPIARSEILYGMQGVLDFLFNSHVANVRKAINDMFVVDPYLVNTEDLKDPQPGKLVRMRRPAWGKGVKDAVQQLQVSDITSRNIADASFVINLMQLIGGSDESMMGKLREGGPERLTGREYEGTRMSSATRYERVAKVISMQGLQDLGYMFASHTQQLMSQDTYVEITGRWQEQLVEIFGNVSRMKVTPWNLLINYDVEVNDGSIPGGPTAMWIRLYDILAKNPQLQSQFNMVGIFEYIASTMGAKNLQNFKIRSKILPDDVAVREAEKGNVIPMGRPVAAGGGGYGLQ